MLRLIAAFLIILGSSAFGFGASAQVARQVKTLEDLKLALFYLKNEMQFSMPLLEKMFCEMKQKIKGPVGKWFSSSGEKLKTEPTASVTDIMMECLECTQGLCYSPQTRTVLYTLCQSLGKSDAEGQYRAIEQADHALSEQLKYLEESRESRSKSYKVLGICAGLALAVILL